MNIFLIGMMGSGKSTVGKNLAKMLDYSFVDTDSLIEREYGKSVSNIFEEIGESGFREKEHNAFIKLLNKNRQVVATGGGLPCFFNHMELMKQNGICVYLKAEPAFLASRLKHHKNERPLISKLNEEDLNHYLSELLEKRAIFFNQAQIHTEAKNLKVKELSELIKKT